MKKFIFMSMFSLFVGSQFLSAGNVITRQKPMPQAANKPHMNRPAKARDGHVFTSSSSSSSSSSRDSIHLNVCCNREHTPTFVSAVFDTTLTESEGTFVATGTPILFNQVMDTSGSISYNPTTGLFTAVAPGSYEISFGARFTGAIDEENFDPCACIALAVNGTELPGTEVSATYFIEGIEFDADWATLSVIQTITAPTTFSVIASNNNSNSAIILFNPQPQCNAGNTTAYITIKKL